MQGKDNNYDTDAFSPIMDRSSASCGKTPTAASTFTATVADHACAMTFLIGDGVLPGNEGSYVLRMILRRRPLRQADRLRKPCWDVAAAVIEQMGDHYTDLR